MLRKGMSDILTQTGPETPGGRLFRSYWIPALEASELPENDCPPVRVKLLSERLVAFRDSDGRYGLIDEFCAHRGVSLWFGRNEDSGIRCPYHGWKYDHTGQCTEVPSEAAESGVCEKIKLTSYPLIEKGGVLWTYMGPPDQQPAEPGMGIYHRSGNAPVRGQALAGKQLAAGHGRRHRLQPRVVPALGRPQFRPSVQGIEGQSVLNLSDTRPHFEVAEALGGLVHRRATQRRERQLLLAHHALGDAELYDDRAARRPSGSWPFLGAD